MKRLSILFFVFISFLAWSALASTSVEARFVGKHTVKSKQQTTSFKNTRIKHKPLKSKVKAKAVYCVNLTNNQTLLARNPDIKLPIASLSKLVTALVALDNLPLNKKVKLPSRVPKIPKSVVGLKPGDTLTVKDLLHGLLMASGNDCAEALAYAYPGGRKKFIAKMNQKARILGAKKTRFYTPSGLDKKIVRMKEGKKRIHLISNVSTAREIGRIAQAAFSNDTIQTICLKERYIMASKKLTSGYHIRSTNKLLQEDLPLLGGKTGYTSRAGHCLATEFACGQNPLLIVVLGSPNHFRDTKLVYKKARAITRKSKGPMRMRRSASSPTTRYYYRLGG